MVIFHFQTLMFTTENINVNPYKSIPCGIFSRFLVSNNKHHSGRFPFKNWGYPYGTPTSNERWDFFHDFPSQKKQKTTILAHPAMETSQNESDE